MVEMAMFNVQRAITPKVDKAELRFISSIRSHRALNLCEISLKYLKWFPTYRAETSTW